MIFEKVLRCSYLLVRFLPLESNAMEQFRLENKGHGSIISICQ